MPSVESLECGGIFIYGLTINIIDPVLFTSNPDIHDLQHVTIAALFFGLGALGLILESYQSRSSAVSLNPVPAIVVIVTGFAMSAHPQHHVFAYTVSDTVC